jgi:hypothetical protein
MERPVSVLDRHGADLLLLRLVKVFGPEGRADLAPELARLGKNAYIKGVPRYETNQANPVANHGAALRQL